MSFTAILFALLIEQARPLASGNAVHAAIRAWVRWSSKNFDAGRSHHAWLAWGFAVGGPTLLALGIHGLLMIGVGWPAAVLWNIAVLYVTLGFRQFSYHFTGIRDALDAGEEAQARERLAKWRQMDASELPRSEIVRHVIEHSVLAAHWHVFGVLGWFSVLAALGLGPAGAVLYRLSEFVTRYWKHRSRLHQQPVSIALQDTATQAWYLIDWLPARVTALGFAVVGSFEEAIDAWRTYTQNALGSSNEVTNNGVILAATSGAVNVRLGVPWVKEGVSPNATTPEPDLAQSLGADSPPAAASMLGQEPELAHLRSIVGLVWRSVVMWMVLLALLTMARLLG
jgi:adenosylcobinamide-phosphate synthase